MKFIPKLSAEVFRGRLATTNALPQLSLLGLIIGLITALVILLFRYVVESGATLILGMENEEAYEQLSLYVRVACCIGGAVLLAALLNRYSPSARRVGVVHVMERLSRHQGYLPLKNAVIQFFGGAIALISGQSGGREGPAIHLGATVASLLGQQFNLPNNSIRTMVACGTASAIAASFNTPIAGVIFAMEVVMMEYTIASFIPIIVASVSATLASQLFFGNAPAFNVAPVAMTSVLEIPYLVLGGLFIGAVAAGYNQLIQRFAKLVNYPFWLRILLAGLLTAATASVLPGVMGVGYDTVNQIMVEEISILLLIALLFGKALTSAASVGLGMPVGLIGPTMVLGACLGGIFGNLLLQIQDAPISVGLYVMLGMGAMMAAVLQAPLAALMAVMEMTANTNLILPAMVIIVTATLVSSHVFGQGSVFIATLNTLGLQYPPSPTSLHLQRVGATAIMDRSFVRLPGRISNQKAQEIVASPLHWILVDAPEGNGIRAALNPADLSAFLQERGAEEEVIDLLELP
ncbi:MAG: CIC family chloride channel protein, partial [Candidatus Azotimanducaceae bacterium]